MKTTAGVKTFAAGIIFFILSTSFAWAADPNDPNNIVATPVFTPDGGTYNVEQNVVITCITPGATIRYTIDGSDPNNGTIIASGDSVYVDHSLTLKAVAQKEGMTTSTGKSATYNLVVATPVFTPDGGVYETDQTVVITCDTPGAIIRYTIDGSDPNNGVIIASGGSVYVDHNLILKVRAWKENMIPSDLKSAAYNIMVSTPTFSIATGTYYAAQNVVITCATAGATIHYATDGNDPNESDPVIASGSSVLVDHSLTLTAKAWKQGMTPSSIRSASYYLALATAAPPAFTPDGGIYSTEQTVTITCATPGAILRYTIDDSDPNEGTVIENGGTVTVSPEPPAILKAKAYKDGWNQSNIKIAVYRSQKYNEGTGEPNNPYQIATVADLLSLATMGAVWNDYHKSFILTADIDMEGNIFSEAVIAPNIDNPVSTNFYGTAFTGIFDGNGHTISNFTIDGGINKFLGLFGYIGTGGQVKNLGVENCTIIGSSEIGFFVGCLAGENYSGTISNCYSTGTVNGRDFVGGLVGNNYYGTINNCYSAGFAASLWDTGGLVGYNGFGTIINCYSTCDVSGRSSSGGLVGYNYAGSIVNCYSTGSVNGLDNVGGLIGVKTLAAATVNSFWDTETSGQSTSSDGIAKTTSQMKILSTFSSAGWDFTNETANGTNDIWRMCDNGVDYPRLNWESIDGDFACPDGVSTEDLNYLVTQWLIDNCTSINDYCGGADIDISGKVYMEDFSIFAEHWLEGL